MQRRGPGWSHHVCGEAGQVLLLLLLRAQGGHQRVDQRVLDVTQHRHGRVHLRQFFDHQDGGEEGGAGASIFWINLDAH